MNFEDKIMSILILGPFLPFFPSYTSKMSPKSRESCYFIAIEQEKGGPLEKLWLPFVSYRYSSEITKLLPMSRFLHLRLVISINLEK